MAEYYIAPKSSFDATADAIREKTGSQAAIEWTEDGFADAISAIGGSFPRLIDHADITFTTTATNANRVTVNLTPATNCVVLVFRDDLPSSPDSSEYIALFWAQMYTSYGTGSAVGHILRPAGTIGSDTAQCSFNKTTGVLQLGGQYGYFFAGTTYHIYEFEIGGAE